MGQFILPYSVYLDSEKLNEEEGWKTWLATFMLLLNLGVVPPKIQASDTQTKIEWVQSLPKNSIELGKFAGVLTRNAKISEDDKDEISELLATFNAENGTNLNVEQVIKYLTCDSYEKDDNTRYKWSFSPSMTSEVGTDIYKLQPAKYGAGVALISDYGDFMKPTFEDSLNKVLFAYEKLTGVEIAVLTIPSLYEADPQEYAQTIFNKWGIGKAGSNNGILILTSMGDRKWFIKTGYGMEGMFPDALCKRFGERYLVPNFKEGDYEKGYSELVEAMKKEFGSIPIQMKKDLDEKYEQQAKEDAKQFFIGLGQYSLLALVIGLIGWLIYYSVKKRREISGRISSIKTELAKLGQGIDLLINKGDPMFDDDAVLDSLKKTIEALKTRRVGKEKLVEQVEKEINDVISQINNVKRIERDILEIKNKCQQVSKSLEKYDDQPTQMQDVAKTTLAELQKINFNKVEINPGSVDKYRALMGRVMAYYDKYQDYSNKLGAIKMRLGDFDETKNSLLKDLKKSKEFYERVEELGYKTNLNVTEEEITNLKDYITSIGAVFMTNLPRAISLLDQYKDKVIGLSRSMDVPIKKFRDIIEAKEYIKEHEKELPQLFGEIEKLKRGGYLRNSDVETGNEVIKDYEDFKRTTENVLNISAKLSAAIEVLEKLVRKGKNAREEEERRKREEEEEERRRKRRQEEEEERRRRNSYSSSYSSGSSWSSGGGGGGFSFGGGSSGGGGAGGSF